MAIDADDLRWDVSSYFPDLSSAAFAAAEEHLGATLSRLTALYDDHDVRATSTSMVDADLGAAADAVIAATNDAYGQLQLLRSYINAFASVDASDDLAQAAMSRLRQTTVTLTALRSRFDAWIGSLPLDQLQHHSVEAAEHAYQLDKSATRAAFQMSESEEGLAALLSVTGSSAWAQLYNDVTAAIEAPVELSTGTEVMPIFAIRGLATSVDADVRRAAYDAELAAWEQHAVPIASALNAIKGEQAALIERRGWESPLAAQLFGQGVDPATLDALQAAMVDSFADFRRYFRAKAAHLGHRDGLPFWDLFAPLGQTRERSWAEAVAAVDEAFASYSPQLQALARRAFDESWIDVLPRVGKGGGAFCMPMGDGDSRVLMNFNGSVDSFMTLAHELGHAYHNTTLADRTPLQRGTPSSLAETASIFCETIMVQHGLATIDDDAELLALLDVDLQGAAQVIVDIHSRFLFESSVFTARAASTISPAGFCDLMADAQAATYGDGLSVGHRWMWAAKPHYYGSLFYNWPYAFGLLFGLGLYARYQEDPDGFRVGYDALLSSTGVSDAAALGARFGIDITDRRFWDASVDVLRSRIDRFCALTS